MSSKKSSNKKSDKIKVNNKVETIILDEDDSENLTENKKSKKEKNKIVTSGRRSWNKQNSLVRRKKNQMVNNTKIIDEIIDLNSEESVSFDNSTKNNMSDTNKNDTIKLPSNLLQKVLQNINKTQPKLSVMDRIIKWQQLGEDNNYAEKLNNSIHVNHNDIIQSYKPFELPLTSVETIDNFPEQKSGSDTSDVEILDNFPEQKSGSDTSDVEILFSITTNSLTKVDNINTQESTILENVVTNEKENDYDVTTSNFMQNDAEINENCIQTSIKNTQETAVAATGSNILMRYNYIKLTSDIRYDNTSKLINTNLFKIPDVPSKTITDNNCSVLTIANETTPTPPDITDNVVQTQSSKTQAATKILDQEFKKEEFYNYLKIHTKSSSSSNDSDKVTNQDRRSLRHKKITKEKTNNHQNGKLKKGIKSMIEIFEQKNGQNLNGFKGFLTPKKICSTSMVILPQCEFNFDNSEPYIMANSDKIKSNSNNLKMISKETEIKKDKEHKKIEIKNLKDLNTNFQTENEQNSTTKNAIKEFLTNGTSVEYNNELLKLNVKSPVMTINDDNTLIKCSYKKPFESIYLKRRSIDNNKPKFIYLDNNESNNKIQTNIIVEKDNKIQQQNTSYPPPVTVNNVNIQNNATVLERRDYLAGKSDSDSSGHIDKDLGNSSVNEQLPTDNDNIKRQSNSVNENCVDYVVDDIADNDDEAAVDITDIDNCDVKTQETLNNNNISLSVVNNENSNLNLIKNHSSTTQTTKPTNKLKTKNLRRKLIKLRSDTRKNFNWTIRNQLRSGKIRKLFNFKKSPSTVTRKIINKKYANQSSTAKTTIPVTIPAIMPATTTLSRTKCHKQNIRVKPKIINKKSQIQKINLTKSKLNSLRKTFLRNSAKKKLLEKKRKLNQFETIKKDNNIHYNYGKPQNYAINLNELTTTQHSTTVVTTDQLTTSIPIETEKRLQSNLIINSSKLQNNCYNNYLNIKQLNKNDDGIILAAYYINNIIMIVQVKLITFWQQKKRLLLLLNFNKENWELIGKCVRNDYNKLILIQKHKQIGSYENCVFYLELRAREFIDNHRECDLSSVYANVYFKQFNCGVNTIEDHQLLNFRSIQFDTVRGSPNDICYVVLKNSRYCIVTWYEKSPTNNKSGICKYSIAPDFETLACMREFPYVNHCIKALQELEDDQLLGIGLSEVTIWDHKNGDLLINIDLKTSIGINLNGFICKEENENYIFLVQLLNEEINEQKQLNIISIRLTTKEMFSWKIIETYFIPNTFNIPTNTLKTENFIITTFDNSSTILIRLNELKKIYINHYLNNSNNNNHDSNYTDSNTHTTMNVKTNKKNLQIYPTNDYILEINDESIIVKTLSEHLLDINLR